MRDTGATIDAVDASTMLIICDYYFYDWQIEFGISCSYALAFLTPGLPFIPAIAITVNIYLIFKLSILTLVRFTIWMTLGLIMYFYYGITHSSLETAATDDIQLNVDQTYLKPQPQPNKTANYYDNQTPTAVWDRHGYENKMAEDSWSTSIPMTNNYSTNSWDIGDVNSAWNGGGGSGTGAAARQQVQESTLSTQPTKAKPVIPPRSGERPAASSSKPKPTPPRPTKQPSVSSQPKSGFSSIFVEPNDMPTWDD